MTAPEPRHLRLFVAVDLPDDVRDALAAAVAPLRALLPNARWIPPESWHVTLKFLGSAPAATVEEVASAVGDAVAEHAVFRARLSGVGAFPSSERVRVVWAARRNGCNSIRSSRSSAGFAMRSGR